MSHSIVPPSAAHIYGKPDGCTGWVLMSQQFPTLEESQDAKEGVAAHEIGSQLIDYYRRGIYSTKHGEFTGELATNNTVFNPEMFHCAEIYANAVKDIMVSDGVFGDNLLVEKQLVIPELHNLSYGTPDCFVKADNTLHIFDFKYGYEVHEVFENWQMLSYLSGVVKHFNIDGLHEQYFNVIFHIVQPRAYHADGIHRCWEFKLTDARGYFNILRSNIDTALSDKAKCKTGVQCKHCTVKYYCNAYLDSCMSLFEFVSKPVPVDMTPLQLGSQLTILKMAESRLKGLYAATEEQACIVAKSSTGLPGYTVISKHGNRKWAYDTQTVEALGNSFSVELTKPTEVVTPAQAENLGIPKEVIKEYIKKPNIGLKLIKDKTNKANIAFGSN